MLALERRNLILEKLQAEKRVVVSELSQLYEVSEETIRRDLDKLEKEGLATKSYGGAVINEDVSIDLPFNIRKNQNLLTAGRNHCFFGRAKSFLRFHDPPFMIQCLAGDDYFVHIIGTNRIFCL